MIIECFLQAKPKPEIRWFRDGAQLEDSDKIEIESLAEGKCRLRISNFQKEDEGTYKCMATNDLGQAMTRCNLKVEGELFWLEFREEQNPFVNYSQ